MTLKNLRRRCWLRTAELLLVLFLVGTARPGMAADVPKAEIPQSVDLPLPATAKEEPIDYTGDKISYDQVKNILRGEGHVIINHKQMSLKADRIVAYLGTSDAYADGNVVLSLGNQVFTGEKVHFNFKTRLGDFVNATGFVSPWYGKGKLISKVGPNEYQITDGYITSCDYEEPHYRIKARKIFIFPKDRLIAKNVTFALGKWNLFWSPLFTKNLKDERQRFTFIPGYNRRLGAFLLSGYNFWLDPYLTGTYHVDAYSKHGVGTGLSFEYQIPAAPPPKKGAVPSTNVLAPLVSGGMSGNFKSYIIDDSDFHPDGIPGVNANDPRYRLHLTHNQQLLPDTRLLAEVNALSDPAIVDDYFRNEFEKDVQPQTFVDVAKNTENYRLALFMRKRVNKIFTELERLPELQFQTRTLPIGDTGLYYSTANTGGYYHQVPLTTEDYESVRLDTFHQLTYPFKVFHWLNIEPNMGYRETFYTKGVVKDDIFRGIFSTGVDLFTKIHRRYPDIYSKFWDVHQLRHVVEPRITYTFVPKPTEAPHQLLQFDGIDALDRQNTFRFGIRQLLQTRREEQTVNLVDVDVFVNYFPDPKSLPVDRFGNTHRFSNIGVESRYKPLDWVAMDLRAGYDEFNNEINSLLADVALINGDAWNISFRQRLVKGQNNLTALEILYRLSEQWIAKSFWRYDFQLGSLEEQEYTLLRDLHCWEVALTFRQRRLRDDLSLFVVFRLKDYPGVPIKFGN